MTRDIRGREAILKAASKEKEEEASEEDATPDLGMGLEEHRLSFQVQLLQQELTENKDNHKLRQSYSNKIFCLICAWLGCVTLILLLSGFCAWGFHLPSNVLITFIGTTTLNVVGVFVIVAKWMFPAPRTAKDTKK